MFILKFHQSPTAMLLTFLHGLIEGPLLVNEGAVVFIGFSQVDVTIWGTHVVGHVAVWIAT